MIFGIRILITLGKDLFKGYCSGEIKFIEVFAVSERTRYTLTGPLISRLLRGLKARHSLARGKAATLRRPGFKD